MTAGAGFCRTADITDPSGKVSHVLDPGRIYILSDRDIYSANRIYIHNKPNLSYKVIIGKHV